MKFENPKLVELREKFHQQIECVRRNDGIEREQLSTQLREIMEAMYDADMEVQRESYESRKELRDQIIKTELERIMDGSASLHAGSMDELFAFTRPTGIQLQIVSDKIEDGVRKMKIHAVSPRSENRTREVPFVVYVEQSWSKVIDGKRIEYTVDVPEQRTRKEMYRVQVPVYQILEIEVPKGEDWEEFARQKLTPKSRRT